MATQIAVTMTTRTIINSSNARKQLREMTLKRSYISNIGDVTLKQPRTLIYVLIRTRDSRGPSLHAVSTCRGINAPRVGGTNASRCEVSYEEASYLSACYSEHAWVIDDLPIWVRPCAPQQATISSSTGKQSNPGNSIYSILKYTEMSSYLCRLLCSANNIRVLMNESTLEANHLQYDHGIRKAPRLSPGRIRTFNCC
jgi:hypothetical protein